MASVTGLSAVLRALQRAKDDAKTVSVTVGYTQSYALPVHERRNVHHPVGKAGFLADPARESAADIRDIIITTYERTGDLTKSVVMGGLLLQRLSQKQCPVDTGALKGSAFTRVS
jgi:hypothetical protein